MSAGWISAAIAVLGLFGCERIVAEPPPAASRHDVPAAAPGARGARAAGSEAAPKPFGYGQMDRSDPDSEPGPDDEEQAPDAGTRPPRKDVPL